MDYAGPSMNSLKLPAFIFSDDDPGLPPGTVTPGPHGVITCRLCARFERMPTYAARWGERLHMFGLHPTCARTYFARIKDGDIIALVEMERLACVGGPKHPRPIFSTFTMKGPN